MWEILQPNHNNRVRLNWLTFFCEKLWCRFLDCFSSCSCVIHHISIHVEHFIKDIFVNLWDVGGMKRLTLSLIVTYKQKFLYYCYSDDVDDNDDSSYFDWILVMMCSSCANRLHENCVHRWTDNTRKNYVLLEADILKHGLWIWQWYLTKKN